jgi:hypothetical protein
MYDPFDPQQTAAWRLRVIDETNAFVSGYKDKLVPFSAVLAHAQSTSNVVDQEMFKEFCQENISGIDFDK